LNDEPAHIDALTALINRQLQGWDLPQNSEQDLQATRERAEALGARY
jgi:ferrochelatase